MKFQTLTIRRCSHADIQFDDASVGRLHAELTLTGGGRRYLTDRNSTGGARIMRAGEWAPRRQGCVAPDARVRFGQCKAILTDLLRGRSFPSDARGRTPKTVSVMPRRNAATGEVEMQQQNATADG